uniref:Ribonuclease H2 subunit A n=1 Tax=Neogobius melanostomus TaxID=47308 RepID=A0A8C6S7X2_9GOBI
MKVLRLFVSLYCQVTMYKQFLLSINTVCLEVFFILQVARDRVVKGWNFAEQLDDVDTDYGSGYPSDPKTKSWLLKYLDPVFGYSQFVRFSWSTAQTLMESKSVAVHWDDDEEDGEKGAQRLKNKSMLSYFSSSGAAQSQTAPHRFFSERRLKNINTL